MDVESEVRGVVEVSFSPRDVVRCIWSGREEEMSMPVVIRADKKGGIMRVSAESKEKVQLSSI